MLLLMINRYAPFGIFGFNCSYWVKLRNTAGLLNLTPNPCSTGDKEPLWQAVLLMTWNSFLLFQKFLFSIFKTTHKTKTWSEKQPVISEIFVSLCLYFLMAFQHRVGELPHSHWLQQTLTECLVSREELQPRPETHNFIRNIFSDQSSAWGFSPVTDPILWKKHKSAIYQAKELFSHNINVVRFWIYQVQPHWKQTPVNPSVFTDYLEY